MTRSFFLFLSPSSGRSRRVSFITGIKEKAGEFISENSTTLLTAGGVVGTVVTAVFAGRAGFKAAEILAEKKAEIYTAQFDDPDSPDVTWSDIQISKTEVARSVAPHFIPPVVAGGLTIASVIMANRMSAQKAAALAAAYGLAEKNLSEYKAKVSEKLTGPKRDAIETEIAQDNVDRTPMNNTIIVSGDEVLCFDKPTGRYFKSTMERIRSAVNATNAEIIHNDYTDASTFYNALGMAPTSWSEDTGWNVDRLMDVSIHAVEKEGRPVLVMDFTVLPKPDYIPKNY